MSAFNVVTGLTNLGDLAVLLPIAIVVFVWLTFLRARQPAAWWAVALAVCVGGTGFLKILFFVCPPAADMHSPSGHTSLSTLIYGGLAILLATKSEGWQRIAAIGSGGALIASIAVSRVVLSSHTLAETGLGIAIGGLALVLFARSYLSRQTLEAPLRPLVLSVAILVILFHGQQLHAEELVRALGVYLRADGLACR